MVLELYNNELVIHRGSDPYEIFLQLKDYLSYNSDYYLLLRMAGYPDDYKVDTQNIEELRSFLPYAEKISKNISDWLAYHIIVLDPTCYNKLENKYYYGGNFGEPFIPYSNRQADPPGTRSIIALHSKNRVTVPSGFFFEVYYWLKDNYKQSLRPNQVINGVVYPKSVVDCRTNKIDLTEKRVYTCGKAALLPRQLTAFNHILDQLQTKEGKFRSQFLWTLHIGYGKTFITAALLENIKNFKAIFPITSTSLLLKSVADYAGVMKYNISIICSESTERAVKDMLTSPLIEFDNGYIIRIPVKYLDTAKPKKGDKVIVTRNRNNQMPINGEGTPVNIVKGEKGVVLEPMYGDENVEFGTFTNFTLVMIPTYFKRYSKKADKSITGKELQDFNVCIVDEVNEHVSDSCMSFYSLFNPGLKVGMSGTPFASPNKEYHMRIKGLFGDPVIIEDLDEGINKGAVIPFDIEVLENYNRYATDLFGDIESRVYRSKERLELLLDAINRHKGESIFIYTGQAELQYGYDLEMFLQANGYDTKFMSGEMSSSDYIVTLERFKRGTLPILISNRVLTSGENLNIASTIIIWYCGTNDRMIIQSIGRILRLYPGKEKATICLFYDYNSGRYEISGEYQLRTYSNLYPDARIQKYTIDTP